MHIISLLISMQAGGCVGWTGAWNANQNLCILSFFRLCAVAVSSAQFLLNLFIHLPHPNLFLGTGANENSAMHEKQTNKTNKIRLCDWSFKDLKKSYQKSRPRQRERILYLLLY